MLIFKSRFQISLAVQNSEPQILAGPPLVLIFRSNRRDQGCKTRDDIGYMSRVTPIRNGASAQ